MNRVAKSFVVLLALGAAFLDASCTSPVPQRLPAVAVAFRPVGERPPSTDEVRLTLQALKPALLQAGASIAERRDLADFVMTVSFTPATASAGSSVKVIGIEPTARLRDASYGGDTPEMKEWQRRLRQLDTGGDNSSPPGTSPAPP